MYDNYRLEKEYTIPFEIFREGYTAFQKKFVFPQSNATVVAFLILAGVFVFAIAEDNSQYLSYLLVMICLAMSARQWYNPRKLRRNLFDAFRSVGETVYKISIAENYAEFSTISTGKVENSDGDEKEELQEEEEIPEKSRIPFDENFSLLEYNDFFLMLSGKSVFYIIPKESFSEDEREIIRLLNSGK